MRDRFGSVRPLGNPAWTVVRVRGGRTVYRADAGDVVLVVSRSVFGYWVPEVSWPRGPRARGPACPDRLAAQQWCEQRAGMRITETEHGDELSVPI